MKWTKAAKCSLLLLLVLVHVSHAHDYAAALEKSLMYFEAQRSGRLPYSQRVTWRDNSGVTDGLEQGVDLVGGYYDAGDHVKFGLPMAFTVTMLSWGVIQYGDAVADADVDQLSHALDAIKWGADYFIKAHTGPNVLWAEVGDGDTDHYCWQRPEDMTTSRRAYRVDSEHPGSDVAAETAAAMAAASIVFRTVNPHYSRLLLRHAQQLFVFADKYRGKYDDSMGVVKSYYASVSGYEDELLWAALWLYKATDRPSYLEYAMHNADAFGGTGWSISEFSWDVKFAGLQILASQLGINGTPIETNNSCSLKLTLRHLFFVQLLAEEKHKKHTEVLTRYRTKAEYYLCSCLNRNNMSNVQFSPGGLLFIRQWNNMQYVSSASFLLLQYSDFLKTTGQVLTCPVKGHRPIDSNEMLKFAKSQVDYILGSNPMNMSYLVGYGPRYPNRMHHRGASIVSYKQSKAFIGCTQGYDNWYSRDKDNPNVVVGAVVGGPDRQDDFRDDRGNFMQTEACTYNTAPLVGVFARLNQLEHQEPRLVHYGSSSMISQA
ncbi:hypothetical protein V2J09_010896 [Rumex salicifolius]